MRSVVDEQEKAELKTFCDINNFDVMVLGAILHSVFQSLLSETLTGLCFMTGSVHLPSPSPAEKQLDIARCEAQFA